MSRDCYDLLQAFAANLVLHVPTRKHHVVTEFGDCGDFCDEPRDEQEAEQFSRIIAQRARAIRSTWSEQQAELRRSGLTILQRQELAYTIPCGVPAPREDDTAT